MRSPSHSRGREGKVRHRGARRLLLQPSTEQRDGATPPESLPTPHPDHAPLHRYAAGAFETLTIPEELDVPRQPAFDSGGRDHPPPQSDADSVASRSTTKGPMGCCRGNFVPSSSLPRTADHSKASPRVGFLRNARATATIFRRKASGMFQRSTCSWSSAPPGRGVPPSPGRGGRG